MPFGTKPDGAGGTVDFDAVYRELIAPAISAAELEALRADDEMTDVFRERVRSSAEVKERLAEARTNGAAAVRVVEDELGPLDKAEAGVVVDLFLSYQGFESWKDMIRLADEMAPPLAATVL